MKIELTAEQIDDGTGLLVFAGVIILGLMQWWANGQDRRDAARRNHAHPRRWYE